MEAHEHCAPRLEVERITAIPPPVGSARVRLAQFLAAAWGAFVVTSEDLDWHGALRARQSDQVPVSRLECRAFDRNGQ